MASGELILLVDDIPDHITVYAPALERSGFHVQIARSGEQALLLARANIPRCAVIDLRLPDMTGWHLCREMKADDALRVAPIIVLTPDVTRLTAAESASIGCHAWLAHPTAADDLVRTVQYVLTLAGEAPLSPEAAILGLTSCPACGSDQVRATVRVSQIQYYCCRGCGFCWRIDATCATVPSAPSS